MNEQLEQNMINYLLRLRDEAHLSQNDIAIRSDGIGGACVLDQRAVSRIEKSPLNASAVNIAAYMMAVGRTPADFYSKLKELSDQLGATTMESSSLNTSKQYISEQINSALSRVHDAIGILESSNEAYLNELNLDVKLNGAVESLKGLNRKPVIGVFGHYDVGKTTILNTVLNSDILPECYQPATSVVNLILHEDDKPKTLKECSVAVFKKGFLPHMVHDPELVNKFLIEKGDFSLLQKLGVHDYDEGTNEDAYIAMVFSTAEILKHVWLLDTPGHLNEEETGDTDKALAGVELIDGLVFVSRFSGFFDSRDFAFFSQIVRQRPPVNPDFPLEHVTIISSHCHSAISLEQINQAKNSAFKRLKKPMNELVFENWLEDGHIQSLPEPTDLVDRTFPFWRENDDYRTNMISEIIKVVNHLTENHSDIVDNAIDRLNKQLITLLTDAKGELSVKKQGVDSRVKALDEQETKFRSESTEIISRFEELISSCSLRKREDTEKVLNYYNANMSAEGLASLIRSHYDDKKDASNNIGALVGQKLSSKVEQALKTSGANFNNELDLLLERWQKAAPNMVNVGNGDAEPIDGIDGINVSAFDAKAAFIGGLTGLGSLGAMSLYVSTTIASNLGAYILVAQVGGWLTSLGITGSVTTATSFVSAIGGPIVVGAVIAGALGYAIYRLVGRDWQTSLGKKVRDQLNKNDVESKLKSPITKYWDNTAKAVRSGINGLIKDTDSYIEKLRKQANTEYDIESLDKCMSVIDKIKSTIKHNNIEI
ncbi:TPA: dynamin family protein [Vibrio alginolyticus]|uniref:dynamin family protein n=1 Tax=unclassified Vibrio TaxID=2614977 RepID=UPI00148263E5|nr:MULTISPECIES: dynamin family protein [unclassified Vibrio]EIE5864408.1 dynamin family protein [Vibrio alginolyticus]MDW1954519.1 dynamin family protein [Vibrio sp. Vb0562]NNN42121.1 hypothetical protein [Vibrio sp. 2-2(2)]NNO04881.1 hypothetical protein [Vibrio sp. 7-5(1-a)]